jgi:carboxymethylenebutenolidase
MRAMAWFAAAFTVTFTLGAAHARRAVPSSTAVAALSHDGMDMGDMGDMAESPSPETVARAHAAVTPEMQQRQIAPAGTEAEARLASSPRHGEWVTVHVSPTDSVVAWLVHPQTTVAAPVIVVIHENTGLTTWARGVADQLAAEGFIAIAPELLTMRRAGNLHEEWARDSATRAISTLTQDEIYRWLDASARFAMSQPDAAQKYGIVGFCWGGGNSFNYAFRSPTVSAAVVYYGTPPGPNDLRSVRVPVLGLYGGSDARVSSTVPGTDSAMKALGKTYEPHIFEGAGHGFLRAQDPAAGGPNRDAALQAWPLTVAWFKKYLGA